MSDPFSGCRVEASDRAGLVDRVARYGLAVVDSIGSAENLLRIARSIATIVPHRDSALNGVTTLVDLGKAESIGFEGFSCRALEPHTDRSGVSNPPVLLMLACARPGTTGGECTLIDGQAVYADLAETAPGALDALCSPRSVLFGGASGHIGAIFSPARGGLVSVRLRTDDLVQFSPAVERRLPALREAIERHTLELPLEEGQGYFLNNARWLHGRRAFTGHRVVHRVNGTPLPHLGIEAGFMPPARSVAG
ncbi:TauD/TfdA family dioxygenase [Actinosynnema mirum]|uniref:Taurine catabolism dioxygenase TauD/TfdA n=1 Tax=Actinosynnema mirum (strain ATCC 29888 / DSM 43827 / JCM 3225 / NBRC 14064 / NCIMB 13271 / NRRL B-12336 / IMRU 3971 / 101) TaxID=446462 RepID=C6WRI3_ACTMD|nr:TauD/TfdA family dioxygenase [Actinosynnema mirum]ACU35235.1 Taurine catabolism dioxygenase TauD/TfdA [Actinosynnema mirum DSM 43827]